jgi:hypothetical protein
VNFPKTKAVYDKEKEPGKGRAIRGDKLDIGKTMFGQAISSQTAAAPSRSGTAMLNASIYFHKASLRFPLFFPDRNDAQPLFLLVVFSAD